MRAVVIAEQPAQRRFACETEDGRCAVFVQCAGPLLKPGDIIGGDVLALGPRSLDHKGAECRVTGEATGLSRAEAMARLHPPCASFTVPG